MLNETTIQRLAFIRYLYSVGAEQSYQPEPLSSASILTFHDSVELFLQLACEHLNVGSSSPAFMEYWDLINRKLAPIELSQKESMRRLNKSRVSLKHHGTLPSTLDIEAFRANATSFFEENTPIVFGIAFQSISLISLVFCKDARESLTQANQLLSENKLDDAMDKITIAFSQLLDDYETRKEAWYGRSPFFFGTTFSSFDLDSNTTANDRRLKRFLEKLKETITSIQSATKILSLGLDYARYAKFRLLTPSIARTLDGTYHISRFRTQPLAPEECKFCFDFVIESALRLQQSDFNVQYDRNALGARRITGVTTPLP